MGRLDGKVVVITGAGGGMGRTGATFQVVGGLTAAYVTPE